MQRRLHTLTGALLVAGLLLCSAHSVAAQKKGFNGLVEHIEKNYQGKRTKIPMLGLANFIVKIIRPAGVKSFKLAVFDNQSFTSASSNSHFDSAMRGILPKEWQPLLRVSSQHGDMARTFIYAKPAGKDLQLMTVVIEPREAVVIEVRLNPNAVSRFMNDPRIMGISLAGNLRGKSSGGPWMGGSVLAGGSIPRGGSYRIDRGNSDIGRRVDPRDEAGYTLTGAQAVAPVAAPPLRPALKADTGEETNIGTSG
ncbi:MAG: hypothetical protein ABI882_24220, partial [Acidobacteriota bacterium]